MTSPSPDQTNGHVVPQAFSLAPAAAGEVEERKIPVAETGPSPSQPRKYFDPERAHELMASLQEHGLLNAIIVYPSTVPPRYRIIAGERRWRAANALGWTTIRARVLKERPADDRLWELQLMDNERQDLSDIERGLAYLDFMSRTGCTASALAQRLGKGKSVSSITRPVALIRKLPEEVRALVGQKLPPTVAEKLTSNALSDEEKKRFTSLYIEGKIKSGDELAAAIRAAKNGQAAGGTTGFTRDESGVKIAVTWCSGAADAQALANVENALRLLVKDLAAQKHRGLTHWKEFLEKKAKAARKASELKAAHDALIHHTGTNGKEGN